MEQAKAKMTKAYMVGASYYAKNAVDTQIKRTERMTADAQKEDRLKRYECKACFYVRGKLGGAAITYRPCGICGVMQMYGSTNTDVLCRPCAVEHGLCKHCGGDIDMRAKRRNWPSVVKP